MRTRALPALVAAAALLAAGSGATVARAGDADKGAAQVLFESGRALVQDKRFAEACPKFAESLRLDPGIGTMLWLADCYENSGKTASAWAEFKEAAATARLKQDARADLASRRAQDLEPKLARLVIVPPADGSVRGLEVRRDGIVIGGPELGIPVPVNPGVHEIGASAPGRKPWSTSLTVVDKPGTVSVVVPVLEVAPPTSAEPVAGASGMSAAPSETEPPSERTWGTRQTVAVASAGAGLLAIGIGSYFGIAAKSTYDDWTTQCAATPTSSSCIQKRESASSQALASDVLFGVGAAAIVAGAITWVTASKARPHALTLTPVLSPQGAAMTVSRAW